MSVYYFLIIVLYSCPLVNSSIDLYLSQEETQRILGFNGELFFIRDGVTNHNAVAFQLPIPHTVDIIKIKWQYKNAASFIDAYYEKKIKASNESVLVPATDLDDRGRVPRHSLGDFLLNMTCLPTITGESLVNLRLNITVITAGQAQQYPLDFNFQKFCLEDLNSKDERKEDGAGTDLSNGEEEKDKEKNKTSVFYMAVGVIFSLLLLIATAVCFLHIRAIPKNEDENLLLNQVDGSVHNSTAGVNHPPQKSTAIPEALRKVRAEQQLKEMLYNMKDFAVRRHVVSIGNAMQEGSFGRMFMGTLVSAESGEEFKVIIKTVTEQASTEQLLLFLAEACMLKRTTHHQVSSPINICSDGPTPLVIYPFMNRGNLKNYLRLTRTAEPLSRPLTTRDIVNIASQLARGLNYLSRRRLIHKDVATRNCVVDEELNVKIADNALSRDFFPGDYHCLGDNENRPVRWMATECLECFEYSPASDVWSYGVLLWELCSLAQTPYASVDPFEMLTYLKSGLRLPQPENCPDDFFTVMACCWALSPDDRPHFQQIMVCLDAFLQKLNAFI